VEWHPIGGEHCLSTELMPLKPFTAHTISNSWTSGNIGPCVQESLARAVFRQHTAAAAGGFDPARSGAEWWVQVRHVDDGQGEAVSFHWDKDEDLVDDYGVHVHPAISTVTYITGGIHFSPESEPFCPLTYPSCPAKSA
jgi:hypothetical protein